MNSGELNSVDGGGGDSLCKRGGGGGGAVKIRRNGYSSIVCSYFFKNRLL